MTLLRQFPRLRTLLVSAASASLFLGSAQGSTPGPTPVMVTDLNTAGYSSQPVYFTDGGGNRAFFVALTPSGQWGLWKTDGTPGGTELIAVPPAGYQASNCGSPCPAIRNLTSVGDLIFFLVRENQDAGTGLWRSDGTASGTLRLASSFSDEEHPNNEPLAQMGSFVYFPGYDTTGGIDLWKSDGTLGSTARIKDVNPTHSSVGESIAAVGSSVFFSASDGVSNYELWKTDGTEEGTVLVKDINPGAGFSYPRSITDVGGMAFFTAYRDDVGWELWKSNGTDTGTELVKDIRSGASGSNPYSIRSAGGLAFFTADDGVTGFDLWRSDGTSVGTFALDINPGGGTSYPQYLTELGGAVFLQAVDSYGTELWKSDGSVSGTIRVRDIAPFGGSSAPRLLSRLGGMLYFIADGPLETGLWRSDGTDIGTMQVADVPPYVVDMAGAGGAIYFSPYDPLHGIELWRSDGTTEGTGLFANLDTRNFGISPEYLRNVNGTLFFKGTDPAEGAGLWKSDGSAAGTTLVKDFFPGNNNFPLYWPTAVGSIYHFVLFNELWRSDGTAEGTFEVKDIWPGSNPNSYITADWLTPFGGAVFFTATADYSNCMALWKSDGTTDGTVLVKTVYPGGCANTRYLTPVGSTLFFHAYTGYPDNYGLWKSDGTADGTVLVRSLLYPQSLFNANGTLFFKENYSQLWKSDGTAEGTQFVAELGSYTIADVSMANLGSTLLFVRNDPETGAELWKSDGTPDGTVLVKDIQPGSGSSTPQEFVRSGNVLFFTADDGAGGRELWRSDGTFAGTFRVKDIRVGSDGSGPGSLTEMNGLIFLVANDGSSGPELWQSDGTEAGTRLVADIYPGDFPYYPPSELTNVNGVLFFRADDSEHGSEVWKLEFPAPVVTSLAVTPQATTADASAVVTWPGATAIIQRGFVYSSNDASLDVDDPGDTTVIVPGTTGAMTAALQFLDPQTTYYIAAFATNGEGTTYSSIGTFTTSRINHEPVASTGGPYAVDLGDGLTLDGSGSSDPDGTWGDSIVSYAWSLGGGVVQLSGVTPSLTAAQISALGAEGSTTSLGVGLTVTDTFGATGTASTVLSIYDNRPVARFTAAPNPAACGQSVSFNASSSSHGSPLRNIVIYTWDFGDGTTGSGQQVTHQYAAFGTYTATLTVIDDNVPPKSSTVSHTVSVNQGNRAPVANHGGPYVVDLGEGLSLNGSGSNDPDASCGDSIVSYAWSLGGGVVQLSGVTPSLTAAQISALGTVGGTTSMGVNLTVTDAFGTTGTASTVLSIHDNRPMARFTVTPNPAACGQSVSFDGSSSSHGSPYRNIVTYTWTFGDGTEGTGSLASHAYPAFGTYTATLSVLDDNVPPKSATVSHTVSVNQGNRAPVANHGGPYVVDLGQGLSLDGSGSSDPDASCGDSIVSYAWSLGGGVVQLSGPTPTLTAEQVSALGLGTLSVNLTVTDSFGAAGSASTSLTVRSTPGSPTIGVATAGNGSVSVTFTAPANDGGSPITAYTAACGAQTNSGAGSPITVGGLPNGVAVTCTVIATNAIGNSAPSAASNSVTPGASGPSISVNASSVSEGNSGTKAANLSITRTGGTGAVTFNWTIAGGGAADGTAALADSDYVPGSGTFVFTAGGSNTRNFAMPGVIVGDTGFETSETFTASISRPDSGPIGAASNLVTITNDDPLPKVSLAAVASHPEGASPYAFTATLNRTSYQTVSVNIGAAPSGASPASTPADFTAAPATLTFLPGATTATTAFNLAIVDDTVDENSETLTVTLTSPTNATLGTASRVGTITDDDPPSMLSIDDVTVEEADAAGVNAVFTVTLSPASERTVTIRASTVAGTAASNDYTSPGALTLTFLPGETVKTYVVPITGDTQDEAVETFTVRLSGGNGHATVSDGSGLATITDNDPPPGVSIDEVTGSAAIGATTFVFTVSLSAPSGQTVTVVAATSNGTAVSPSDFSAKGPQTVTFAPGQTTKTFSVAVKINTAAEGTESFNVNLSGAVNGNIVKTLGVGTITN